MGAGITSGGCCNCGVGSGTGGVGTTPFCFCAAVPTTLDMTTSSSTCNYGMFQSCEIVYQITPAAFAPFGFSGYIYTSYPVSFPDPVAGGARFYYYLTCQYNQYSLTRLYLESPYGSPFRDAVLYSWLIGGNANTCTPFSLQNGTGFPGNDASCYVTIEGA